MYKMRELRGEGMVTVTHVPTDLNSADLFTKILSRQVFEKHRKKVLNLPGDTCSESARKMRFLCRASRPTVSLTQSGPLSLHSGGWEPQPGG